MNFRYLPLVLSLVCIGHSEPARPNGHANDKPAPKPATTPRRANSLEFEPNLGQTDKQVRYLARRGGTVIFVTDRGAVLASSKLPSPEELRDGLGSIDGRKLQVESQAIRMTLAGGRIPSQITASQPSALNSSYFIGNDKSKWISNVPHFGRVLAKSVYPGIDIAYYGKEGQLEYDLIVGPNADPGQIRLAFSGQDAIRTAANGDLVLATKMGDFIQRRPKVYQDADGRRTEIAAAYHVEDGTVGLQLARYDRSKPLVIDPVVVTSTYFGGALDDVINGVSQASSLSSGTATYTAVTGYTSSTTFPSVNSYRGGTDAFISLIDTQGIPTQTTYVGGSSLDIGLSVAALTDASIICAGGETLSNDFPVTAGAFLNSHANGSFVGFIACFQGLNQPPSNATYVGNGVTPNGQSSASHSQVNSVYFPPDGGGDLWVGGGGSNGSLYSFTNGGGTYECQHTRGACNAYTGDQDAFFGIYHPTEPNAWIDMVQIGGSGDDVVNSVSGHMNFMVAGGATQSNNLLTISAVKGGFGNETQDAALFVYHLLPNGSLPNGSSTGLILSTYYGSGNGNSYATAVQSFGGSSSSMSFAFAGSTNAVSWPGTGGALATNNLGGEDGFLATASTTFGSTVINYSTLVGGNGDDFIAAIVANYTDPSPVIYATGNTRSTNLLSMAGGNTPPPIATQGSLHGTVDGFLFAVLPGGQPTELSYLGGNAADGGSGIAFGDTGHDSVIIGGNTNSSDFLTTPGAYQRNLQGGVDGFFTRIWVKEQTTVGLNIVDPVSSSSLSGVPFMATLNNCSTNTSLVTPWVGSCNANQGSIIFTLPAHYQGTGVRADFLHNVDGTNNLTTTVNVPLVDAENYYAQYTISNQLTVVGGAGAGTVTPVSGNYYASGIAIPITATAQSGYTFSGWTRSGQLFFDDSTKASTNVTMYGPGTITANFTANQKITPVITWATPAPIVFGSALSAVQLNATANVPGTFVYTPPAGTVLTAGMQTLSAQFTPTDTGTYSMASASVSLSVQAGPPGGLVVTRTLLRAGADVDVVVNIANTGAATVTNVTITSATFGTTNGTGLPINLGTIAAGGVGTAVFTLPAVAPGGSGVLTISGTYDGGSFRSSSRTTLP